MSIRSLKQRVEFAMRVVIVELERTTNRPHHDAALPTSEDTLWQELVACLLGSVVPFPVAQAFAEHLGGAGLLKRGQHRFQTQAYERDLAEELSTPIPVNNGTRFSNQRYRFPRLRASHIRRTAEAVFGSGGSLTELLENASDERLARQRLVASAVGIGPKQASLFLRNIGHARNLAILDVHVLRFVEKFLPASGMLGTPNSLRGYERVEDSLRRYAETFGAPLCMVDTAMWIVMRVLQQEELRCL